MTKSKKPASKAKLQPISKSPAKKPAVKRTGRKCSICHHAEVAAINVEIRKGTSFRNIASRVMGKENHYNAVHRHALNCLKIEIAALIAEKKKERALDVYDEFEENLVFAKRLRQAAYEYLSDPVDPLKISIVPFAHEIEVTYFDNTDLTEGKYPKPKKKRSTLDKLLCEIEMLRNLDVDKVSVKHVDLRSFALDSIRTTDTCLDKFARMGGVYQSDKENAEREAKTIQAVNDFLREHPNVPQERVIDAFVAGRGISRDRIVSQLQLGTIG